MNFLCVHTNKKSVNWFKEITAAWKNSGLEIYELPKTLLSKPETVAGNGSISGLQLNVVDGALRIYDLLYPSHFDRKLYASIVEHLEKGSFGFHYKNDELTNLPQYLSEESFYKMNGDGTHAARFQSGVTTLDKDWFAMKVYYILEKTKALDTWLTGDIVGLNLSFSI